MGVRLASHAGRWETRSASVVVEVEGVFDLSSARCVREALQGLRDAASVSIDFSRAGHIHDCALANVASALAAAAPRVHARGLNHHQARLLRYLGIDSLAPPVPDEGSLGAVA